MHITCSLPLTHPHLFSLTHVVSSINRTENLCVPGMCIMNYEPICVANGAISIVDGDDFCVVGMHTERV